MGVDAELLELSWNNSKPTPCLLVRPTYQATSHHAAAAACVLNARAPLGVTHHTNERARETRTTAPPCPPPTNSTRGTGRAIPNELGFVSQVVVVVVSSAVVGRVFGSSTEEPNGGRHRGGKLKYPALGVCFYVPSVICPGPIRLCPAQNDQKGVRATTGKLGIFLIWVFCRRPQFSRLINEWGRKAAEHGGVWTCHFAGCVSNCPWGRCGRGELDFLALAHSAARRLGGSAACRAVSSQRPSGRGPGIGFALERRIAPPSRAGGLMPRRR